MPCAGSFPSLDTDRPRSLAASLNETSYRPAKPPVLRSARLIATGVQLRRVATTLALALSLLGCAPTGEPVKLMTLTTIGVAGCCVPCVAGVLVPSADIGTVIRVDKAGGGFSGCELHPTQDTHVERVAWPAGYTGRWAGSEVEVLNGKGEVVATTGQRYECSQEWSSKAYLCERAGALDAWVEPPPQFDLAEVKAKFAQECENPTVLEDQTCDLIDIDGKWRASRDNLFVPMTLTKMNGVRGQRICEQIAAADLDVEPPGYEIVVLEARNGKHLGVCDVP